MKALVITFPTVARARKMGRDCALNGPNTRNCHFSLFASPELTQAWEQGKREAEQRAAKKGRQKFG